MVAPIAVAVLGVAALASTHHAEQLAAQVGVEELEARRRLSSNGPYAAGYAGRTIHARLDFIADRVGARRRGRV